MSTWQSAPVIELLSARSQNRIPQNHAYCPNFYPRAIFKTRKPTEFYCCLGKKRYSKWSNGGCLLFSRICHVITYYLSASPSRYLPLPVTSFIGQYHLRLFISLLLRHKTKHISFRENLSSQTFNDCSLSRLCYTTPFGLPKNFITTYFKLSKYMLAQALKNY